MAEKLTNAGSLVTGGLMYRIERSRYYVQEYKEQMRRLRVSRLEGFQPYTDFVRRRLFKTFDFIDRVGRRYTEVRTDIELLLDEQRSDLLAKRQSDTNKLLESAEFIISVPLVYYIGHILHDLSHELFSKDTPRWISFLISAVLAWVLLSFLRSRREQLHRSSSSDSETARQARE